MRAFARIGRKQEIVLPAVDILATIVVPSRYPDIFEGCRSSLAQFAPRAPKILVRDRQDIADPEGWKVIQGSPEPFVYARNVNLGIQGCSGDVLLMNDDAQFTQEGTLEALQGVFALRPDIGILSPRVDGIANGVSCMGQSVQETKHYISFVCVLIRRSVFEKIGLLDEKYTGYGSEDVDFCRRAQREGFTLAVTSLASVSHKQCSSSYVREHALELKRAESERIYLEKWGRLTPGHYSDEI
jgi:GT2 family glycosyltransferase